MRSLPSGSEYVRPGTQTFSCKSVRLQARHTGDERKIRSKRGEPMRFTIAHDRDGYRARLYSGSDLVWWTEGYERKAGALNAIRIAKQSYAAPVKDLTQRAA
jgi:uncharacterized protein YegP (UPF0339 family)